MTEPTTTEPASHEAPDGKPDEKPSGRHDGWKEPSPEDLRATVDGWDNRLKAAALGVAMFGAALYPLLLDSLTLRFGTAPISAGLAILAAVSTFLQARLGGATWGILVRGVAVALAGISYLTGDIRALRLIPTLIYTTLAVVFLASLREETSLVERGAKLIEPVAPDFIGPYCRGVTALWGGVLLLAAVVLAGFALGAPPKAWRLAAGTGVWSMMAAISAAEFLVRKSYFRNYWHGGPFERQWAKLFPAEDTAMGRRSAAYIRMVRGKLERQDFGG